MASADTLRKKNSLCKKQPNAKDTVVEEYEILPIQMAFSSAAAYWRYRPVAGVWEHRDRGVSKHRLQGVVLI